jgi:hypothetical protein
MKDQLSRLWDRVAAVILKMFKGIGLVLFGVVVMDWGFYALNQPPPIGTGWGGLLVLTLALLLFRLQSLAEAVHQHYIGPWSTLHTHDQQELARLKNELKTALAKNKQLSEKLNELEALQRQKAAEAALERLNPTRQVFQEEL